MCGKFFVHEVCLCEIFMTVLFVIQWQTDDDNDVVIVLWKAIACVCASLTVEINYRAIVLTTRLNLCVTWKFFMDLAL